MFLQGGHIYVNVFMPCSFVFSLLYRTKAKLRKRGDSSRSTSTSALDLHTDLTKMENLVASQCWYENYDVLSCMSLSCVYIYV
jgi:hypothetical protein